MAKASPFADDFGACLKWQHEDEKVLRAIAQRARSCGGREIRELCRSRAMCNKVVCRLLPAIFPEREALALLVYGHYCLLRQQSAARAREEQSQRALRSLQHDGWCERGLEDSDSMLLLLAAGRGHWTQACSLLCVRGNERMVTPTCSNGFTLFHITAAKGHRPFLEQLLLHPSSDALLCQRSSPLGRTALHVAVFEGHDSIIECLLQHPRADELLRMESVTGLTCLHLAVAKGHLTIVQTLLAYADSLFDKYTRKQQQQQQHGRKQRAMQLCREDQTQPATPPGADGELSGTLDTLRVSCESNGEGLVAG